METEAAAAPSGSEGSGQDPTPGLRALLDLAGSDERIGSLARAIGVARYSVTAAISTAYRPFVLSALADGLLQGRAGSPTTALVVAADDRSSRDLAAALASYLRPLRVLHYPSRGVDYLSHLAPPPHLAGLRVEALAALESADGGGRASERPAVVVAGATALAEVVPEAELRPKGFAVEVGAGSGPDSLADSLASIGYERVDQVSERGEFAVRGGLVDVFPSVGTDAARVEYFGDEVESIRRISVFTQRSLGEVDSLPLAPSVEWVDQTPGGPGAPRLRATGGADERPDLGEALPLGRFVAPLDLLPERSPIFVVGVEEIASALRDHWDDVTAALHADDARRLYVEVSSALESRATLRVTTSVPEGSTSLTATLPAFASRSAEAAESEVEALSERGLAVVLCFAGRAEAERARERMSSLDPPWLGAGAPEASSASFAIANVSDGFISEEAGLAVVPWTRLVPRRPSPVPAGERIGAAIELRVGDFVVHADHGIARFVGFDTKTVGGITRDYLELEYDAGDRVFAPTEQLARITRYVGPSAQSPKLSALGGKRWANLKARARNAAQEMAGELLNLYAERRIRKGHRFPADGEWQRDFEAAFPYEETPDQLEAIEAVKRDMESERPMDRLICGDVGYGKTEVALRAAHKAAADGRQVLVLAPTTLLAQQHFATFSSRLESGPFQVELVSRLRSKAEVESAIDRFREGTVDILVGTHRLLSRDVRAKDLGLVIVDEEQRFGVKQKELLKRLKLSVDVLSMSATPIPRTLQMSLAGLRDISLITTPPQGRRPVRTYVGAYDEALVERALTRETARGGQSFFLHNSIDTLHATANRLRALCPEIRFVEAHGQLPEAELEGAMLRFVRGEADCLVTTTIIEAGLDIPTANTLVVDRADRLGLSQAYQIRGRVGRGRESSFAYMLYPSDESLSAEATARLVALADNTELGSGFRVAMRDLEIRGAGNLLGDEQSGHVAAVGFELYSQMLEDAASELEATRSGGAPPHAAPAPIRVEVDADTYLPSEYIGFEAAKIDIHRRLAAARDPGTVRAIRAELADRFGSPPEPAEALIDLAEARVRLAGSGLESVEVKSGVLRASPVPGAWLEAIEERLGEVRFDPGVGTLSMLVGEDPSATILALSKLADAIERAAAPRA